MSAVHKDPRLEGKTGQPKDPKLRQQMFKAHGRYSASDAKEGRPGRLPSTHAPARQPRPAGK